ncbi:hypothetical protein DPMN_009364 [Dreissena polymorpha]|uniref:Uncharacterized protein n=1 Tax=Dreissena polymorpha TaxID=45954 RepID=A0A9D4N0C8_DREPO|nr:hypothetical protein DPMN_009364 [Dreissena polymorpha]
MGPLYFLSLSPARQAYLYKSVRPYIRSVYQDSIRRRCVNSPSTPFPRAQRLSPSTPTTR